MGNDLEASGPGARVRRFIRHAVICGSLACIASLGCGQVQLEQTEICEILTECGQPREACELFEQVRASAECKAALANADCAEHQADVPSYTDVCFPICDPSQEYGCLEDGAVVHCRTLVDAEVRLVGIDCGVACSLRGQTYTGVCGKEYVSGATTLTDVNARCWCE